MTWDDKEYLRHDYLLIDNEEMAREHLWDISQYPLLPQSEGSSDYYNHKGYTVQPGNTDGVLEQLASAYGKQFSSRAENCDTVFLEVKVQGDKDQYEQIKNIFFGNVFAVIGRMPRYLTENIRLRQMERVECNFNDAMHILTFFPEADDI